MSNINSFLRENVASIGSDAVHIAPNIDEKKLNNAIKSFGYTGSPASVIALFDNTIFGSAKEGLLFSGEKFIYKEIFTDPVSVSYNTISAVELVETPTGKSEKVETSAVITRTDGSQLILKNLTNCNFARLVALLNSASTDFTDFKEERQLVPVNEMTEALKVAYVKVVINMAYANDGEVDRQEFAELLLLMTRIAVTSESRLSLRSYMTSANGLIAPAELMQTLSTECPEGQEKSLHISLVKDLVNTYFSTGGTDVSQFAFLQENRGLLKVTDQEIELAVMAIQNDRAMLKEEYTDDMMVAAMKSLSSKAAAVGVPLAAVYLSGSVIGLSAAGMTSGLATLGMGGLLGMSSMATGIGVAVLLGVGAYAGVRKLTGADELSHSKRRELMLNEVIKQTQSTISLLIQDINFITEKLNGVIQSAGAQDAQIQRLMKLMQRLTSAGTILTNQTQAAQQGAARLRCAQFLDERKLKLLTREPTKVELYGFIMSFYEEREIHMEGKDGASSAAVKLAIKKEKTVNEFEALAAAFVSIGYFDTTEVLKGNATDLAGRAKSMFAEILG